MEFVLDAVPIGVRITRVVKHIVRIMLLLLLRRLTVTVMVVVVRFVLRRVGRGRRCGDRSGRLLHRTVVAQISRMGRGVAGRGGRNIVGAAAAAVAVMLLRRLLLVVLMILVLVEHAHFVLLEVAKEQLLVNVETEREFVT